MRRPYSVHCRPEATTFSTTFPVELRAYFQRGMDATLAEIATPTGEPVKWPTVIGFCRAAGVNHHTMRSWARQDKPGMRDALRFAAETRAKLSELGDRHGMRFVFDTEQHA